MCTCDFPMNPVFSGVGHICGFINSSSIHDASRVTVFCPHGLMGISLPGLPEMIGDRDCEHVVAVRASSTANAGRMAVLARSSGHPKRLRVVGHFHRISQTTIRRD